MNLTGFFKGIGSFCTWTFKAMPTLGPIVNLAFIIIVVGLILYWMSRIIHYNKIGQKQ